MKKVVLFIILTFLLAARYSLFVPNVFAICPICTVAVGAGLGISRALGVDDAVTSVWIGGLVLSVSFWLIDWMLKKNAKFQSTSYKLLVIIIMYLLVIVPLIWTKVIGLSRNKIFGVDKIIFGTVLGSLVFLISKWADQKVRQARGKQLFNYQRVIFPVLSLTTTSLVLYFITK
jgi:hypothetical protein